LKILVMTDHNYMYKQFLHLLDKLELDRDQFDFRYSDFNQSFLTEYKDDPHFKPLNVKNKVEELCQTYDLVISLHCRQIFPKDLVEKVRCVNVHPGYNPHNRGWYPHVFSILNALPAGVTIHEMDEKVDNGPIIVQRQVEIFSWDTSDSVYNKILKLEVDLLEEYLHKIIAGNYEKITPANTGNYNSKEDYKNLCEINLDQHMKAKEFINLLRALSHGDYKNAYFIDEDGNKVWIKIVLERAV
jgi:Methionyl-tRNA formyltransferase